MSELQDEIDRLADGRELNSFDQEAVATVAGLTLRLREARDAVEREGMIIDDGKGFPIEHPALIIEKRASAEVRGWVKDRPDLFGERKPARAQRQKFTGLKSV